MMRPPWAPAERFQLLDRQLPPPPDPAVVMRRIAAEAVILQDDAESVLAAIARGEHLGVVAPRGGPLVRRFFALADQVPPSPDSPDGRLNETLRTILTHHAMQIATALDFAAVAGRSARAADQVRGFGSLGEPARILEEIYSELVRRT